MFIENKYYKWYKKIISSAKQREEYVTKYYETHHIIPKALGGTDDPTNLVRLTAREHFVSHILLTKFTSGEHYYKMLCACNGMRRHRDYQSRYINSRLYETVKKRFAEEHRARLSGKKLSPEHRTAISNGLKGRKSSVETIEKRVKANTGKKRTPEQRERMRQAQLNRIPKTPEQKKQQSEKAGKKISEKLKGRKLSNEHKEKISKSLNGVTKGKPKSEETKQKMRKPKSEAHKKAIAEARRAKYKKLRDSNEGMPFF